MIGRIGAQTAKQVIIQKIREAERDSLVRGVQRPDRRYGQRRRPTGAKAVRHGFPVRRRSHSAAQRADSGRDASPQRTDPRGHSRSQAARQPGQGRLEPHASRLVRRLFEQEIPEIADGVISINALARESGYRTKVAVSSADQRVDCVGACVGVRGNRIKNIVDELSGERIDIVRWSDDPEKFIPAALQPAEVEQVLLCDMIGRAIVLVREDQLSLAIGRRGQNVRLASKLCGWDIEIMTADELEEQIERAVAGFAELDGISEELAQALVEQGYLSYDDLSVIEPDALMEMGGLSPEQVERITEQAESRAEQAEHAADVERRRQRERQFKGEDQPPTGDDESSTPQPLAASDGSDAAGRPTQVDTAAIPLPTLDDTELHADPEEATEEAAENVSAEAADGRGTAGSGDDETADQPPDDRLSDEASPDPQRPSD